MIRQQRLRVVFNADGQKDVIKSFFESLVEGIFLKHSFENRGNGLIAILTNLIEFSCGWKSSRKGERNTPQPLIRRQRRKTFEQCSSSGLFRYIIFRLFGVPLIESPNKSLEYLKSGGIGLQHFSASVVELPRSLQKESRVIAFSRLGHGFECCLVLSQPR